MERSKDGIVLGLTCCEVIGNRSVERVKGCACGVLDILVEHVWGFLVCKLQALATQV